MFLKEIFFNNTQIILEGGNLEIDNPNFNPSQPESPNNPKKISAQEIQLQPTKISDEVQDRTHMVGVLKQLFKDINERFAKTYKVELFNRKNLDEAIEEFMAGSSKHFFDLLRPNPNFIASQPESEKNPKMIGISDEEFKRYKPNVGDIDIQCNQELQDQLFEFLNDNIGIPIGNATLLGNPSLGNEQYNTLWQLVDPPIKLQIDFEYGRYSPVTGKPDEWTAFSHSADWGDIKEGIKGVFHKYIYRALAKASPTPKYVATLSGQGKKRAMTIFGGPLGKDQVIDYNNPPEPVVDANFSFAVASKGGGGIRAKYRPLDPKYGLPQQINGIPVLEILSSESSEYVQDLNKQFTLFFNTPPKNDDRKLQNSFLGTLQLMNKYLSVESKRETVNDFLSIIFEPGSQMITRDDPNRDRSIKFAAVDKMLSVLELQDMAAQAEQMSQEFIADYNDLEQFKQQYDAENPNPGKKVQYRKERKNAISAGKWQPLTMAQPLNEQTDTTGQPSFKRKGIPHIYAKKPDGSPSSMEIKDLDFLDLCQEIANNGGTLDGIQINEKIDGAGIRFGKNQNGNPFFMIGGLDQQFYAGDVGWFEQNSKGDPERAKAYDMAMDIITNSKFIQSLPADTLVQSEMLFDPNQQENSVDGVNTFVNIPYQTKQLGRTMTLVPILVKQLSTGQSLNPEIEKQIINILVNAGDKNIKIISNNLEQKGINVASIIQPVIDNYDQYKTILSSRKKSDFEAKQQIQQELNVVRKELSDTIIKNPKLQGLGKLGEFYEGIVINMPGGPVKVTSQEMKTAMIKKMENQFNKSDESSRVAVVAIGSMVGHKGHEQLINLTIDKARELKGKAFIYVGDRIGPDDPIPVDMKLETLHKIFGANNEQLVISAVQDQTDASGVTTKGSHFKKIEKELVKKRPFYNRVYVMVGSDYAATSQIDTEVNVKDTGMATQVNTLQSRLASWSPTSHVKIELEVTPRDEDEGGTGKSTSQLRQALKNESTGAITNEEAFNIWRSSFSSKIDDDWILQLMDVARQNMNLRQPQAQSTSTLAPVQNIDVQKLSTSTELVTTQPVTERLFNALIRPRHKLNYYSTTITNESQNFDFDSQKQSIIIFINNVLNNKSNNRQYNPFYTLIVGDPKIGGAAKLGLSSSFAAAWKKYFQNPAFIGGAPEPWSQVNIGDKFTKRTGDDRTLNYYITVTKDKDNIEKFFKNIHKLPDVLKPISDQYQTPIKFKTHSLLDSFIGHNDSLKVYYYDIKVRDLVVNATRKWLNDNGITTGARSHEHGVDVKSSGGSFGQILSNHIYDRFTKLIQDHGKKFTPDQYFDWLQQNLPALIRQVQRKDDDTFENSHLHIKDVAEGGFSSRATQATVVTPNIVRAAKTIIDNKLIPDLNKWILSKELVADDDIVSPGAITGSGAHNATDPQDEIYGDIDMQIVVPDLYKGELHTTGERQYRWKKILLDFIKETNPTYLDIDASLDADLPVVKLSGGQLIQVDLMPAPKKYQDWSKYRATAERGITGLLNGNLFAVLSELLTVNLQHSGVQFKMPKTGGLRQKFDSLKKGQYDLGEISYDVETFVLDILKDEHQAFGKGKLQVDPLLSRNPGVQTVDNIEDLRIQPLINAIKGLARSFELNNLYGKGNLSEFLDADDFLRKFKDLYELKANYAASNKKFDKAETPELKSHVARKQEKIRNGLEYVKFLFDTNGPAPRYIDWLKNNQTQTQEAMLSKSAFAGTGTPHFHKLGHQAHAKGKQKGPVRRGQFVGGSAGMESIKINKKSIQTENIKYVPISGKVENIMQHLINKIIVNEAIQNKK